MRWVPTFLYHLARRSNLILIPQVLTGNIPYAKHNDAVTLSVIQAGEIPQKPSEGMDGTVWEFLEKCWSRDVTKRPSSHQVYDSIFRFRSLPQVIPSLNGRLEMEELPGKLRLQVQSIRISLNKSKQHQLCVKIKYGNRDYTTAPTMKAAGGSDEYVWFAFSLFPSPSTLSSPTQEQSRSLAYRNQPTVPRTISLLRSDPPDIDTQEIQGLRDRELLCESVTTVQIPMLLTIHGQLLNNVNKRSYVKLEGPDVAGSAVLKILLTRSL